MIDLDLLVRRIFSLSISAMLRAYDRSQKTNRTSIRTLYIERVDKIRGVRSTS
jgi:hypothetical protein